MEGDKTYRERERGEERERERERENRENKREAGTPVKLAQTEEEKKILVWRNL